MRIIRKPNKWYCFNCIQHKKISTEKEKKSFYCWVFVDYSFKLDLTFYKVVENTNEKMLLDVYKNQILELVIKLWLLEGQDFLLKADDNSEYKKTHN